MNLAASAPHSRRASEDDTGTGIVDSVETTELICLARKAAGLSQAELARRAGTSQPAVARYERGRASPSVATLERLLLAAGQRLVLTAETVHHSADLRTDRMQKVRMAKPQINALVRAAGAANVRVFGSVARGEDKPDSDIDFLVDFDVTDRGAIALIKLRNQLEDLLGERVDVVTSELLLDELARVAASEAVPL